MGGGNGGELKIFISHDKFYLIYVHGYHATRIDIKMISNHFSTVSTQSSKISFKESLIS